MIYVDTSVVLAELLAEDRRPDEDFWTQTLVSSVGYLPFGPRAGWNFGNGRVMSYAWDLNYDISLIGDSVSSNISSACGGTLRGKS